MFRSLFLLSLTLLHPFPLSAAPGDYWLKHHNLSFWEFDIDHDLDGFTTGNEYQAGTDPRDANSIPAPVALDLAFRNFELQWTTSELLRYGIDHSEDLINWFDTGLTAIGDGNPASIAIIPEQDRQFYRLKYLDPLDGDGDGLSDVEERDLGTRPDEADTDGDSLRDGHEVLVTLTDPLVPNLPGGTISGRVFLDPNHDGNLADGEPMEGAVVFLDGNYNGRLDSGERTTETDPSGMYEFTFVPPGVHHVRQELTAPNVQTVPPDALAPSFDMLPDEVVNYTHAAPGVGQFDLPYGENASDWPANWGDIETSGPNAELVPSVDLVLKPIGVRNKIPNLLTRQGSEFLTMPAGSHITLRFDEPIVDLAGPDFLIYSISASATTPEQIEVLVGPSPDNLTSIGIHDEALQTIPIDLETYGIPGPIHYVKCISQNNGGDWFGFELVGMEAINIASPDPGAHIVVVTSMEIFNDRDFGRHFRDLPPTVILSASDDVPATPGFRAGETITAQVRAFDDIGITTVELKANGQVIALDANNRASVPLPTPGSILLEASALDSAGQVASESTQYYVLDAGGAFPFDPNRLGQGESPNPNAPAVRILTPGPGTSTPTDTDIIADIVGSPAATSWTLEYAPVNDIDPYDLTSPDPDYIPLASGSGNVHSSSIATMPLSSLPDGIYFLRLCAQNAPTQVACYGQVIARNVPEADLRPQITIDSPAPGANVTMTADITGTITSTRPLREWYVEYARADQVDLNNLNAEDPDWVRIASGSAPIDSSALIANFDGTTLKNNGYILRLVARNDIGLGWVEPLALEVTGEAKLGRNRLEFRDLTVELAGFPLQFVRVYDSLQAGEDGELGYGWSFDLQDPDIRETVPDTGALGLFGSTPFRDGTRVYITSPTGQRLGFTFKPEVGATSGFGSVYKAVFTPDPGVYHTLEIPEGDRAFLDLKADGNVFLFFFNFPYNPSSYILTDPEGNRYTYHEKKGFLQAEDRNGNRVTLNEDGVEHSAGLSLRFERDGQGRITKVVDPENDEWLYAYDANGDLETVTDPDGRATTFAYFNSPAHYLDSITDPLGRIPVRYEYDPVSGRLDAIVDEAGNRQEVAWNPGGFTGSVTDRRGKITQFEYDARGNVTRRIDPLLNETLFEYNDPANPDLDTALIDADGERFESTYNSRGQLTVYRLPNVTGIAGAQRLNLTYDTEGNLTKVNDFGTHQWDFTYDASGNLLDYDSPIAPSELNTYSPEGLITSSTDGTGAGYLVDYGYDANGMLNGVEDNLGYGYGLTLTRRGRPQSATDGGGNTSNFTYDQRSIPTSQEDPGGNTASVAELPDGSFNRTTRSLATDNFKMTSDELLEQYTQPNGGTITPTYNKNRRLETITDPNGNTVTYTYNDANLLIGITDPLGKTLSIDYNAVGKVSEIITRTGKRRTFEYDANRRITFERWHDGGGAVIREFAFTYAGSNGSLDIITDTQGTVVHTHDIGGKLPRLNTITATYSGQQAFKVDYGWSDNGDDAPNAGSVTVKRANAQLGRIIANYFGGRIAELAWTRPGTGGGGNAMQIRRTEQGRVSSVTRRAALGAGTPTHSRSFFTYDAHNRLDGIRHDDGTETGTLIGAETDFAYTRDLEGRIDSVTQPGNTAAITYDDLNQVLSRTHSNAAIPDETYSYDINGNRTSSHNLPAAAVVGAANRITSIGNFTYLYDDEGNVSRRTNTTTSEETNFSYDHRNHLIEATVHPSNGAPASDSVRFEYDFADRIISREINGAKTWILYDRQMAVAEFADGATDLNAMFFYSPQRYDAYHGVWRDGIGERWFLKDDRGSIRGITDESGTLLSWVDYDAFGNLQPGSTPSSGETCRYAGRFYVEELGLYENRRRFYDPVLGRFLQEDPVSIESGDINFYRYAFNSPTNFRDPLGTAAALEASLLDANTTQIEAFCAFGNCVGNLWSGVVRGFINLETTDGIGDAVACAMDLIEVPYADKLCDPYGALLGEIQSFYQDPIEEEIEAQWKFLLGGPANNVRKKGNKLKKLVLQCAEDVEITTEPVEIPPAKCGTLRGLAEGKGPFF